MIKYFIEQGLTLADIRSYNNRALRWAAQYGHLYIIKYLIKQGLTQNDIGTMGNNIVNDKIKSYIRSIGFTV